MDTNVQKTLIFLCIGGALFFLGITIFVLYFVFANQKRKLKMDFEKADLDSKLQLAIESAQSEIRNETLIHVSRELHDNVTHVLGTALLFLGDSEKNKMVEKAEIRPIVKQAMDELRAISRGMVSDFLSDSDLLSAIKKQLAIIENVGYVVKFGE